MPFALKERNRCPRRQVPRPSFFVSDGTEKVYRRVSSDICSFPSKRTAECVLGVVTEKTLGYIKKQVEDVAKEKAKSSQAVQHSTGDGQRQSEQPVRIWLSL
jgi:hypothetical protein